jgi:hypothetical protein
MGDEAKERIRKYGGVVPKRWEPDPANNPPMIVCPPALLMRYVDDDYFREYLKRFEQ